MIASMRRAFVAGILGILPAGVHAQVCGQWEAVGVHDLEPGLSEGVSELHVFDDGQGAAVYASGGFGLALENQPRILGIAKWTDAGWESAWSRPGAVTAVTVLDRPGPDVMFIAEGNTVFRREGATLAQLGSPLAGSVSILTAAIEAGAEVVYAVRGSYPATIERWSAPGGGQWTIIGAADGFVSAFTAHDDGGGPALFIGGWFPTISGQPIHSLARWRNGDWTAITSGLNMPSQYVVDAFTPGDGKLFATPMPLAGQTGNTVAYWDGSTWTPFGGTAPDSPLTMCWFDDGSGPSLIAGCSFLGHGPVTSEPLAYRITAAGWTPIVTGSEINARGRSQIGALAVHDDGQGPAIYIGGVFSSLAGVRSLNVARLRNGVVEPAPAGARPEIQALDAANLGDGEKLYVGGSFHHIGGVAAQNVARFDGQTWSSVGTGVRGVVYALESGSPGGVGPALFAGGTIDRAGDQPAAYIARFAAGQWSGLGAGISISGSNVIPGAVRALRVHDDGSGPALYVGGRFGSAGGVADTRHIARWNGSAWSALGGPWSTSAEFLASRGDRLYASIFQPGSAGGISIPTVGFWNGSTWAGLPYTPLSAPSLACRTIDGADLLFAGNARMKIWNGVAWTEPPGVLSGAIQWLLPGPDGDESVYAFGLFQNIGALHVGHVASYSAQGWRTLGGGLELEGRTQRLRAAAWVNEPGGRVLYVGGSVFRADGQYSPVLARWRPCPPPPLCYANCDNSAAAPILNVLDFGCFINRFNAGDPYANCDGSTTEPVLNVLDFGCFLNRFTAGCP